MKKLFPMIEKIVENKIVNCFHSKGVCEKEVEEKKSVADALIKERYSKHLSYAETQSHIKDKDGFAFFMAMRDLQKYDPTK